MRELLASKMRHCSRLSTRAKKLVCSIRIDDTSYGLTDRQRVIMTFTPSCTSDPGVHAPQGRTRYKEKMEGNFDFPAQRGARSSLVWWLASECFAFSYAY